MFHKVDHMMWHIIQGVFLTGTHTSYLSQSSHVRHVEKNLSCGEISDFYTWQMGRNLINVAEFQISPHDRCGEL